MPWTASLVQVKFLGKIARKISEMELVRPILITAPSYMPEETEKFLHVDAKLPMNASIS